MRGAFARPGSRYAGRCATAAPASCCFALGDRHRGQVVVARKRVDRFAGHNDVTGLSSRGRVGRAGNARLGRGDLRGIRDARNDEALAGWISALGPMLFAWRIAEVGTWWRREIISIVSPCATMMAVPPSQLQPGAGDGRGVVVTEPVYSVRGAGGADAVCAVDTSPFRRRRRKLLLRGRRKRGAFDPVARRRLADRAGDFIRAGGACPPSFGPKPAASRTKGFRSCGKSRCCSRDSGRHQRKQRKARHRARA